MDTMRVDKTDGYLVVHAPKEITNEYSTSTKEFVDHLFEEHGVHDVILNLSHLNGVNSCGIGFMVSLHTRCVGNGKRLHIYKPGPQAMKTLHLVQLDTFFNIVENPVNIPGFPDVEELYSRINDDTETP